MKLTAVDSYLVVVVPLRIGHEPVVCLNAIEEFLSSLFGPFMKYFAPSYHTHVIISFYL
jgi:hypothetical protein